MQATTKIKINSESITSFQENVAKPTKGGLDHFLGGRTIFWWFWKKNHSPRHLIILKKKKEKKKSIQLLISGTCRVATDGKSECPDFP